MPRARRRFPRQRVSGVAALQWSEMGWWYVVVPLLLFLGQEAAQGPDPGSRPPPQPESTQGPDAGPTPDRDPGPTPGSTDYRPLTQVSELAESSSRSLQTETPKLPEEKVHNFLRPISVTNVSTLCVCDLLAEECDINCCCDPDCSATDFSLFSTCSIPIVSGDSHFCVQKTAIYDMNFTAHPPTRLFQLVEQSNPSLFCIHTLNYKVALSFITPEFPSENNFDNFLKKSSNFAITKEPDIFHPTATKYTYAVPVQTSDSFLRLPSPLFNNECTDHNPVGFLVDQVFQCNRRIIMEMCKVDQTLSMDHYSQPKILARPNSGREIPIKVLFVFLKSLNKTVTRLSQIDDFLPPTFVTINGLEVCTNVVLKLKYRITYTEAGEITKADVRFLLGTVNSSMLPIQQQFQVQFLQENIKSFRLSGNPGYLPGLPLLAGFEKDSVIIQSINRYGQFTILHSTLQQDCLLLQELRQTVFFDYDVMSGCKLRLNETINCRLVAKRLKNLLMGRSFPQYVSSFGNSQSHNLHEWVPIHFSTLAPLKRRKTLDKALKKQKY
ncbi:tectonic-1 isoform X2 [Dromiciops gliroides]|uniref:tectonic-1 isoform X2 n=1 Tax=Dromiciops gliroides TaxID=33562 RepID=UPI001CC4B9D7|nr:tectonic-1 isoform X2 [Dromiciops gliroides]